MPSRKGPEGKIFKILNKTKCTELDIDMPEISRAVRRHLVLVLDWASHAARTVKCMTITSNADHTIGEYLPISPNPKNKYPMQIQLDYGPERYFPDGSRAPQAIQLPKFSFLKIDVHFEVPLAALYPAVDGDGNPFMIKRKKIGGLGYLRAYLMKKEKDVKQVEVCKDIENMELRDNTRSSIDSNDLTVVREVEEFELEAVEIEEEEEDSWQAVNEEGTGTLQDFVKWASGKAGVNNIPWEDMLEAYFRYKGAEALL